MGAAELRNHERELAQFQLRIGIAALAVLAALLVLAARFVFLQVVQHDVYRAKAEENRIAIVPVGLCYPGTVDGGDLPPMPACAPLWQPRFRAALPRISLTLLVGSYAQKYYLGARRKGTLAETVRAFRDYLPEFFPLPHPSWRNKAWLARNPWFEKDVIPALRRRVNACMRPV